MSRVTRRTSAVTLLQQKAEQGKCRPVDEWVGHLLTGQTGKAELLIAFFASVFIDKVSYASVLRGRV